MQSDGEKRKELRPAPGKRKMGVEEGEIKNKSGESAGKRKTTMIADENEQC